MTEELKHKQKAEEYFKSICKDYNEELERTGKRHYWVGFDIKNAYIAGAIETTKELEKENKNLEGCLLAEQEHTLMLEKQIEKMKSDSKTAYNKGIRTMANALKKCDRTEGAWTDYFEHTVDKVLKNLLKE